MIEESFKKQRRNLVSICTFLIIYFGFDIQIKTLNIFGNKFPIGSTNGFEIFFLILFLYFLVRYHQYATVLEKSEIYNHSRLNQYIQEIAKNKFERLDTVERNKLNQTNHSYQFTDKDIIQSKDTEWVINLSGTITYYSEGKAVSEILKDFPVTVCGQELFIPKLKDSLHLMCNTPSFTEYVFPYAFSTIVSILTLYWRIT